METLRSGVEVKVRTFGEELLSSETFVLIPREREDLTDFSLSKKWTMATMSAGVAERHAALYGSGRRDTMENLRKVLNQSSVLQSGEYNMDMDREKEGLWKSSTSRDFTVSEKT